MKLRPFRPLIPAAISLITACALLLSACGNKGPLTLPPKDTAPTHVKAP